MGTGIVVDRLVDMTALAAERETVMRPHAEWHLYERQRRWYDRVWDWYTVEGPFVRKHDGRYWCFYSYPQPCPPEPLFRDLFGRPSADGRPSEAWRLHGSWALAGGELVHRGDEARATAIVTAPAPPSFLFEVNLALARTPRPGDCAGVLTLYTDDESHIAVLIDAESELLRWRVMREGKVDGGGTLGRLRPDFDPAAFHQLLIRQGGDGVGVALDGVSMGSLPGVASGRGQVGVCTSQGAVTVAGVALTDLG